MTEPHRITTQAEADAVYGAGSETAQVFREFEAELRGRVAKLFHLVPNETDPVTTPSDIKKFVQEQVTAYRNNGQT